MNNGEKQSSKEQTGNDPEQGIQIILLHLIAHVDDSISIYTINDSPNKEPCRSELLQILLRIIRPTHLIFSPIPPAHIMQIRYRIHQDDIHISRSQEEQGQRADHILENIDLPEIED